MKYRQFQRFRFHFPSNKSTGSDRRKIRSRSSFTRYQVELVSRQVETGKTELPGRPLNRTVSTNATQTGVVIVSVKALEQNLEKLPRSLWVKSGKLRYASQPLRAGGPLRLRVTSVSIHVSLNESPAPIDAHLPLEIRPFFG